ncbi:MULTISPECIES: excinuclease ABC subunit UvrA [Ectothiorhodospira]|uniref:excinuclease ABC subunit UvrA n=1 Tax=Ectothiorhodospira TaxID=1051 RepID=UPI00047D0F48|nr:MULTISPECIES: excinuclease ABC subunit UvrA [Ectothiorhodospira]MCG5495710.1 excinuclease ABC subunit UvrA [Ectothiorhodospira variabilis]MCG5498638.1 excinuclease ABC subunit UvrA [Ectothiorhodospira variabilis]MCG5503274.1 excinuclease ABC subunit UvrA [Ectothiorhodospira variabilis]MCG5505967.1 excinuclease ABC subunit UvrA [Ectothiorhodospira variabilis]MCG5523846.1 excinuclease ABC subunit UvrA [Ectothiorhodospira haloalkaliphila]
MEQIIIRGARTHNLQSVDLVLPRDRLIVITGVSGSGKSSLAFDTLFAEGQRRYVESLSAYARQFLSMMEKPDVDHIEGLSPAISIEQKTTSHNPRSTVGTITEIYDYLRLLFARAGTPRCPEHGTTLEAQTVSQMVDQILALPEGDKLMLLAPVVQERKGEHLNVLEGLRAQGYLRARIDGELIELDDPPSLEPRRKHTIEVVVDRFRVREDIGLRLAESLETALNLSEGLALVAWLDDPKRAPLVFSSQFACAHCGYAIQEMEPRMFSFNNPVGACPTCDGLGVQQFFDPERVVAHPELSLAGGAVRGWDRRNAYYFQLIQSLAAHYGFDIETPFEELPDEVRQVVLHGSGREKIHFEYANERGRRSRSEHAFEGIIPNLQRRYRETDSSAVREELAKYRSMHPCPACQGTRLNQAARNVFVDDRTLPQITALPIGDAHSFFTELSLPGKQGQIADKIVKEIVARLNFLVNVGLDYLTLDRSADTLSGGEAQRIRLASQIGAGLVGVMYILDEPSIGLHQRDNERLLNTLTYLRDLGNTVLVVEHDEDAIRRADHVVDMGPGAGRHGGRVVAQGTPAQVSQTEQSLTGQYLSGRRRIEVPTQRHPVDPERLLRIIGARGNNLRNVDMDVPVGLLTCVTGVSGSGKSTLINDTLYRLMALRINKAGEQPAPYERVEGAEYLDKVVDIDQSPIGRTPRSNPATYTGLFTPIRELFAGTQEARSRGYAPGRFSFNVRGGRCEACQGDGVIKVEMHFLPDVYVPCDICRGKRYNRETLDVRYKGKNIHEVLEMTVEEAVDFFEAVPVVKRKLDTLMDVGLSYVQLGQNATTLSGGEAQRVKLARELSKRDTGRTLYILDEPTTGLHFEDVDQLLKVLHRLRDHGNTVVVIEHNLDVIKTADWLIDLGPEGGSGGGEIIATGTPEAVAAVPVSHTGRFLAPMLGMSDSPAVSSTGG